MTLPTLIFPMNDETITWYTVEETVPKIYQNCQIFYKVNQPLGHLSNMAGSYPLTVNGVRVPSAEALYQALRFPHRPDWQEEIIAQKSPMAAKMVANKEGRRQYHSRSDWNFIISWVDR